MRKKSFFTMENTKKKNLIKEKNVEEEEKPNYLQTKENTKEKICFGFQNENLQFVLFLD